MNNPSYVLGVDVAKDSLETCLMQRDGERVIRRRSIQNLTEEIGLFLKELPEIYKSSLCVAVEPTGLYWYPIADTALSLGHKVVSAPTIATRKFLESISMRAKNDRIDAKGIARYACHMELRDYTPKTKDVRNLESHLAARKKISLSISEFTQAKSSMPEAADIIDKILTSLRERLNEVDAMIGKAEQSFSHCASLQKLPGVGPVVSGALAAKLTQNDFKTSDSFVAFIGLDVRVRESGRWKGKRKLTKNGDPEMRRLLYLAAQASLRSKDRTFAQIYENHLARGLSSTASLCAVARKLARTSWSMVHFNTEYDPARVFKDKNTLKREQEL
jgi:transposase